MITQYFARFETAYGKAFTINAEIRFVRNPKNENYGRAYICTDYDPVHDHPLYNQ